MKGGKVELMKYNYLESIKADIKEWLEANKDIDELKEQDIDELAEELHDELWTEDSITGNGSGSYTFCRETAKEYVTDNMDDCILTIGEFCMTASEVGEKFMNEDWEYFDVSIRCYYLSQAIQEVLEEILV